MHSLAAPAPAKPRSAVKSPSAIYKSMDAGKTWALMGLGQTGRIPRLVIDPRNPDVVCACALGYAYGPQPDRGVFCPADGGESPLVAPQSYPYDTRDGQR